VQNEKEGKRMLRKHESVRATLAWFIGLLGWTRGGGRKLLGGCGGYRGIVVFYKDINCLGAIEAGYREKFLGRKRGE